MIDYDKQKEIEQLIDDWMNASKAFHGDYTFVVGRLAGMFGYALGRLSEKDRDYYIERLEDDTNWYQKKLVEEILEKKAA
jgi:hypothetical protein